MATIDTTYQTYQAKGIREDLDDVISDISPTDTPFMSNGGKGSCSNTLFEWQTETLAAPNTANVVIEGEDITAFPAADPTVRVGNYTQISNKLIIISGTLDRVSKAGRNTELAHQLPKLAKELKRDQESMLLENIKGYSGLAAAARTTAGLPTWLKTNTNIGSGGVDPTYSDGVPATARTDGTQRNITEALAKDVMQQLWASGASLKIIMVGPVNKANISSQFGGIATQTYYTTAAEVVPIIGAADVYVSDFGSMTVVPNRFQRERDCWFLDNDYYSVSYLRPYKQVPLATTGDATKRMLICEYGLKVKNEAALGALYDLNTAIL